MRNPLAVAGLAALVIALAGALLLHEVDAARSPAAPRAATAVAVGPATHAAPGAPALDRADDEAAAADGASLRPERAALPGSLRGTRIDGGLVTDASGRFVPTPDARRLFDYFLAASGEEPDDVLAARVRAEIDRRLAPDAARDAHLLFDRYLAYRARARSLAEAGLGATSLEERLATLRALRRETLGDDAADALFAAEEAVDEASVRRLAAAHSTDQAEAARLRDAADAALPPAERAHRAAALAAIDLRAAEAALAAEGSGPDQLRALRERMVGAAAADRLAALDAQRADWQRRLADYRAARLAIAADASLDAATRDAALERLRGERFSASEQLRVAALDGTAPP